MDKRVLCVDAKPDPYMGSWRFEHRKETGTEVPFSNYMKELGIIQPLVGITGFSG